MREQAHGRGRGGRASRAATGAARAAIAAVAVVGLAAVPAAEAQVVKMASLVPDGSIWDQILEEQAAAWERATGGRLDVRIYPGGVAGDDPALVMKMRIGQFQAAALTFVGLIEIDEAFRVLAIPLFYESPEELFHVLERLDPVLRSRLEERGFSLLNWGYVGWARFYSRHPIRKAADLQAQKLFLWGGEESTARFYRSLGLNPVGVAGTDVTMALQTGMIECIGTPPLVALSLQWFRQARHQLDLLIAPFVGATVVSQRAWNTLDPEARQAMLATADHAEGRYMREVPDQEEQAIAAMEERGLIRTTLEAGARTEWDALSAGIAAAYRGDLVPADIYDLAVEARAEFRRQHSEEGGRDRTRP